VTKGAVQVPSGYAFGDLDGHHTITGRQDSTIYQIRL